MLEVQASQKTGKVVERSRNMFDSIRWLNVTTGPPRHLVQLRPACRRSLCYPCRVELCSEASRSLLGLTDEVRWGRGGSSSKPPDWLWEVSVCVTWQWLTGQLSAAHCQVKGQLCICVLVHVMWTESVKKSHGAVFVRQVEVIPADASYEHKLLDN